MAASASTIHLRDQIEEDLLTCSICCEPFRKPRALPCLHTYCEDCLTTFLVENNHIPTGVFPCPVCRSPTPIPPTGVAGFRYNHMVDTLADTVEKSRSNSGTSTATTMTSKPVPAPRRSKQTTVQVRHEKTTITLVSSQTHCQSRDVVMVRSCGYFIYELHL